MASRKNDAPAGCDPARGNSCNCSKPGIACHCKDIPQKFQQPKMGSALRSFLKRYAADLQPYAESTGDVIAAKLVDCCGFLLTEADRLEGGA